MRNITKKLWIADYGFIYEAELTYGDGLDVIPTEPGWYKTGLFTSDDHAYQIGIDCFESAKEAAKAALQLAEYQLQCATADYEKHHKNVEKLKTLAEN